MISGVTDVRVCHGDEFDAMAGVKALDKEDGDLTFSIVIDGSVDTLRLGQYVLVYSVTDEDGNETTVTRTRTWTQTGSRPAYQGIDQAKLVPLLTAALQEAISKIETLETKVAALEAAN